MKIEKRGKYPGIKVHLEPDECEPFITLAADHKKAGGETATTPSYYTLAVKLGKKIAALNTEDPGVFTPRTQEEIKAELEEEMRSSAAKLAAMQNGSDWTTTKVKVFMAPFKDVQKGQMFTRPFGPDPTLKYEVANLAIKNAIVVSGLAHQIGLTDLISLEEIVKVEEGGQG